VETDNELLWNALVEVGLIPGSVDDRSTFDQPMVGTDLIPLLARLPSQTAWNGDDDRPNRQQLVDWMIAQGRQGAQLTFGLPVGKSEANPCWLGCRLAFVTSQIPKKTRVGLVSSRLSQNLETHRDWFRMLRTCCAEAAKSDEILVVAESTAPDEFISRAAMLFGASILKIKGPDSESANVKDWLHSLREFAAPPSDSVIEVYLSPALDRAADQSSSHTEQPPGPLRDRATVVLSDRIHALRLRKNGHIHRLLRHRLEDPSWPTTSIQIARGSGCVVDDVANELQECGAVGWVLISDDSMAATPLPKRDELARNEIAVENTQSLAAPNRTEQKIGSIADLPASEDWQFLTHCTRRRIGPWPGQSRTEYLDDLILDRPSADHSPFAALMRIVEQQCLYASGRLIRGSYPVVSFSAVPLRDLPQLRTFRPHLARWDFEPYGICISRAWLDALGAKPVVYGNEQTWQAFSEQDRPYFQRHESKASTESSGIDWSIEIEWRHQGDVSLSDLPSASAILFVPTKEEAKELEKVSRWPITILSQKP